MTEKKEKNFMDYLPIIIAILLFLFVIYMLLSERESTSPSFKTMSLSGTQDYNISSAFGIAK